MMNSTSSGSKNSSHDVVIVGAGIIGLSIAHYLQQDGRKVTLVDRKGIANEASFGNAGAFAFSDIFPLASPGMLKKAPKWLLDPLGPLSIPPAYFPQITPWLLRFWRASWRKNYALSCSAQSAMLDLARAEINAQAKLHPQIAKHIKSDGALHLYESAAEIEADKKQWDLRKSFGIEFEHIYGAQVEDYQPGLSKRITAATFIPKWQTVDNPHDYATSIWQLVAAQGGELVQEEVDNVSQSGDTASITLKDGRVLTAKTLVIASGAWSHQLTAQLGDKIPLETERGYNTTLPTGAFDLKRQLIFSGHGFVITPLSNGIRVGGAVELGGLKAAPNYKRSEIMLQKAKKFLPDLAVEGGVQWMGFRPSLPDSLPVVGPASHAQNIYYAFGHGHLGLTQSMSTARLIADMVAHRQPALNLSHFRSNRF